VLFEVERNLRLSPILGTVHSGLSPFRGLSLFYFESHSMFSLFYVESHSEFSPFGVESPSVLSLFYV
jgi:hypothetical protein